MPGIVSGPGIQGPLVIWKLLTAGLWYRTSPQTDTDGPEASRSHKNQCLLRTPSYFPLALLPMCQEAPTSSTSFLLPGGLSMTVGAWQGLRQAMGLPSFSFSLLPDTLQIGDIFAPSVVTEEQKKGTHG